MKVVRQWIVRARLRKAGLIPLEAALLSRLAPAPASLATLTNLAEEHGFANGLVSISLREHTVTALARLKQAALVLEDGNSYSITYKGSQLLKKLEYTDDIYKNSSPATASRLTVIFYLISVGLSLPGFLFTGSLELLAWGCITLAWIGSFLLAWNGIHNKKEKRAAFLIGSGTLTLALGLLVLGTLSLFSPFIVRRLLWVSLTLTLLGGSALALFLLARLQSRIAREHASFSFAALAHRARRHALLALFAILACMSSYASLHFVVSVFLILCGTHLFISAARILEALHKRLSAPTALTHWFEHLARHSRDSFFLSWLEQVISERGYTKSEILSIYQQNFVAQTTPFFDDVNVNLSRDAWFEDHLDTLLGHLLYDNRAKIENNRFVHKTRSHL